MTGVGVVLYGPPAAGKDTVTAALVDLDIGYRQFRRLKVGPGRTTGYRMASPNEIDARRDANDIVWENNRYGAAYYVDREFLARELTDANPIIHLGQIEAVSAIRKAFPETQWLVAYLWCPRHIAKERIAARGTNDTAERLAAWDKTPPLEQALFLDTSALEARHSAQLIDSEVQRLHASVRT